MSGLFLCYYYSDFYSHFVHIVVTFHSNDFALSCACRCGISLPWFLKSFRPFIFYHLIIQVYLLATICQIITIICHSLNFRKQVLATYINFSRRLLPGFEPLLLLNARNAERHRRTSYLVGLAPATSGLVVRGFNPSTTPLLGGTRIISTKTSCAFRYIQVQLFFTKLRPFSSFLHIKDKLSVKNINKNTVTDRPYIFKSLSLSLSG